MTDIPATVSQRIELLIKYI